MSFLISQGHSHNDVLSYSLPKLRLLYESAARLEHRRFVLDTLGTLRAVRVATASLFDNRSVEDYKKFEKQLVKELSDTQENKVKPSAVEGALTAFAQMRKKAKQVKK